MPKYELPKVDGFSEEQVKAELEAQGKLDEFAVPDDPAPVEAPPEESDPAPAPPQEGVTDEPEDVSPLPKTIPYERFAEAQRKAREKEAEYARQLDEYRRQQAELLKEQQAFLRTQMEARKPQAEPEEEDPLKVLIRTEAEAALKPIRQKLQAQEQMASLHDRITKSEAEAKTRFTDFDAVTAPVVERMKQAAEAAQRGDAQAGRWLGGILQDENPAMKLYALGLWEARAKAIPPQSPTIAPPQASPQPPRGNPPALPRGTQVQGSNSPEGNAELRNVVNMSLEEFAAWRAKNPALATRYLKGEI